LKNLENYISRLLKVHPEPDPMLITSVDDIPIDVHRFEADLVIAIAVRPFSAGSKMLGAAFPVAYSRFGDRPGVGGMYLNSAEIPKVVQSENSLERLFFTVAFHEIVHVLGFMGNSVSHWLDKTTGEPYNTTIVSTYRDPVYSKTYRILHTPSLHNFVSDRYGIEEFAPGIPAGIEIEDGGGGGTAGSHPEARVYGAEVMCGIFVGYVSISNLTLAALDDMGWYEVNFSMAEPYSWGDGRSMLMAPLTGFPRHAPQLAYPRHYLCWENNANGQCNHDYRSKAYCSPSSPFNCQGAGGHIPPACAMRAFVNPANLPIKGDVEEFDYLWFKVGNVSQRCEDVALNNPEIEARFGEVFGVDSMCAMSSLSAGNGTEQESMPRCFQMFCDEGNHLIVQVGNEMKYCRRSGELLEFNDFDGFLTCPKPQHICGMKRFLGRNPVPTRSPVPSGETLWADYDDVFANWTDAPTPSFYPFETTLPTNSLSPSKEIPAARDRNLAIMYSTGAVLFLLICITIACIRRRRAETPEELHDQVAAPHRTEPRLDIPTIDDGTPTP
jgi:hypothetical protein